MREATVERATAETWVWLRLGLDGPTGGKVDTGLPFLDHMLLQLQRHGRFLLEVEARGDLEVDVHHLVEDVGIALGMALKEALGDGVGLERYAEAFAPMDETLVLCVLDLSGRPHLEFRPEARGGGGGRGEPLPPPGVPAGPGEPRAAHPPPEAPFRKGGAPRGGGEL